MLHKRPAAAASLRQAHPSCLQPPSAEAGSIAHRERELWNDTITPAEQAAREPSGMSCLSKALSAPFESPLCYGLLLGWLYVGCQQEPRSALEMDPAWSPS